MVGQQQGLGPDDQVDGEQDHGQPRGVDGEDPGEMPESGVFAAAHPSPVFDAVGARWRASRWAS